MSLAVALAGLGLLQLPWVLRHRIGELSPDEGTRVTSIALRTGLHLVQFGLLATAAPTVLARTGATDLAASCAAATGGPTPGGALTGWTSAFVLGWVFFARWRARRHVRDIRDATTIEPSLGRHTTIGDIDLVVIPTAKPLAYTVPGHRPQIVVSEGLRDAMTSDELAAVIRHETSHLRRHHDRDLLLACELEATFGPAGARSTRVLRLAVERCADEDAITAPQERRDVREALTKTAVILTSAVPAFTPADTILARLVALDDPPAVDLATRARTIAMIGAPVAAATVAAAGVAFASHHLWLAVVNLCLD